MKRVPSHIAAGIAALAMIGLTACGNQSQQTEGTGQSHTHEHGEGSHTHETEETSSATDADVSSANASLASATDSAKEYPLEVCIVSDEKLGSMGEPESIVWQGQTVKFCCSDCIKEFKSKPEEHLAKLTEE